MKLNLIVIHVFSLAFNYVLLKRNVQRNVNQDVLVKMGLFVIREVNAFLIQLAMIAIQQFQPSTVQHIAKQPVILQLIQKYAQLFINQVVDARNHTFWITQMEHSLNV